jgi:hypothetical protein
MGPDEPDKDERTKNMRRYDERRQKRADRLFHWSLDMPPGEDDVDVRVNKQSGLSWKELVVIAGAGLGGFALLTRDDSAPAPTPVVQPASGGPVDSDYDVRFYDKDGNLIDVPHISEK